MDFLFYGRLLNEMKQVSTFWLSVWYLRSHTNIRWVQTCFEVQKFSWKYFKGLQTFSRASPSRPFCKMWGHFRVSQWEDTKQKEHKYFRVKKRYHARRRQTRCGGFNDKWWCWFRMWLKRKHVTIHGRFILPVPPPPLLYPGSTPRLNVPDTSCVVVN